MRRIAFAIAASLLTLSAAAHAAEAITYTYDARERLVTVVRSGTVNDGRTTTSTLDKADNRTAKAVTAPT